MLQVGGVDPKQLAVYEEFARNVPGFLPSNDLSQPTGFLAQPMKVSPLPPPPKTKQTKNCLCRSGGVIVLDLNSVSALWLTATGVGHR